ncbi:hypothetical protein ACFW04_013606 [Cataglyphis niger]
MATSAAVHLLLGDSFKNLTEEDLKILISNIGPRRKFQNNVKKYLNENCNCFISILIFWTTQSIENVDPNNQSQAIQQDLNTNHVPIKKQKKDSKQNEDNEINEDNISITENISPIPSTSSTIIFLTNNAKSETEINAATDNKYNLESILKKSEDGQLLLSLYKNEGKLNNDQRNKLAKIIVSNELSPNIHNTQRKGIFSDV